MLYVCLVCPFVLFVCGGGLGSPAFYTDWDNGSALDATKFLITVADATPARDKANSRVRRSR